MKIYIPPRTYTVTCGCGWARTRRLGGKGRLGARGYRGGGSLGWRGGLVAGQAGLGANLLLRHKLVCPVVWLAA